MSEIIKSEGSQISAKKTRAKRVSTKAADKQINTTANADLTDVAIAAADTPFKAATEAYNQRFAENLQAFGQHIVNSQQEVAALLTQQIYSQYGLTETQIYGETQDDE